MGGLLELGVAVLAILVGDVGSDQPSSGDGAGLVFPHARIERAAMSDLWRLRVRARAGRFGQRAALDPETGQLAAAPIPTARGEAALVAGTASGEMRETLLENGVYKLELGEGFFNFLVVTVGADGEAELSHAGSPERDPDLGLRGQ